MSTIGGIRFLITHILPRPREPRSAVRALLAKSSADIVVFGHSHIPLLEAHGLSKSYRDAGVPVQVCEKFESRRRARGTARHRRAFVNRTVGETDWENYTPYELRTFGTFICLGQPERAHELFEFFFRGQCPPQWRQWAEVVWRDPKTPRFIGDMPHGWVGSDYLRSALDMFAYDRDDGAVVIDAAIRPEWTKGDWVVVRGLHTRRGTEFHDAGHSRPRIRQSGRQQGHRRLISVGSQGDHVPADIVVETTDHCQTGFRHTGFAARRRAFAGRNSSIEASAPLEFDPPKTMIRRAGVMTIGASYCGTLREPAE